MGTNTLIEFLKVIISWPVAITVIMVLLFFKFHDALECFFRNIGSIKGPGGIEIQRQNFVSKELESEVSKNLTSEDESQLRGGIKELTAQNSMKDEQNAELQKKLAEAWRLVKHYHFEYLSLFLVPTTKQILK